MELQNILIEEDEDKSESSKDIEREEEKWSDKNYNYFRNLQEDLKHSSNLHNEASHKNKRRYVKTAVPSMIIPLFLTNLTIFCSNQNNQYIQPIGLTFIGILNGFNSLLNFSKKCEVHNTYAGKYMELSNEIDKILIRSKKHRQAFDLCLERITLKKQELDASAPYL